MKIYTVMVTVKKFGSESAFKQKKYKSRRQHCRLEMFSLAEEGKNFAYHT
jgi:hypothetical protein